VSAWQTNAFPVHLVQVDPANLGTADAAFFAQGANGLDYCVKTVAKTPAAPAAELICNSMAALCGIATAQFDIVKLLDGSLAFGSVWEGSALERQQAIQVLMGKRPGRQVGPTLSRVYAFDLFVHNVDRHLGNYLCVGGRTPGHSVKVYDFSRAFSANGWPLPSLPMPPAANTVSAFRQLNRFHAFDLPGANEVLTKIDSISFSSFKSIIDSIPSNWMSAELRKKVGRWWVDERSGRVSNVIAGLKDGSFL
jgi:hypothetical protein